ncbi:uncharacterized protein BHQ10_003031 [Talaromyces amestolkiae]|uniref:2EXR domain-containing protein n=1 Tax=Talaromyces amestolkiae TaxID=1196081 RepID=A0A364KU09_TALAM|nr:uncharacterized protein BHQ10_003031 [Talaromyces amestolkiae]RAO67019.1 hypothetical protein BHQ10_003031 [Talaromyces amestolkiae]
MAPIKTSSSIPATTFHLFPWLPIELRLEIWRLCLPHRVCEKDVACSFILFNLLDNSVPAPCFLYQTTKVNGRPPVITRVCHESRAVALKAGGYYEFYDTEDCDTDDWDADDGLPISETSDKKPYWDAVNCIKEAWFDPTRDVTHLHWEPKYQEFFCIGSPLKSLAWDASRAARGGSFTIDFFQNITYRKAELIDFVKQMPSWKVVMRVIVIHADSATAASTGLFGLLGDAPVQLVDVYDEAKVDALWKMAKECDSRELVTVCQGFHRISAMAYHQVLRDIISYTLRFEDDFNADAEDVISRMRPVIMFRLCTEMCNRIGSAAKPRAWPV